MVSKGQTYTSRSRLKICRESLILENVPNPAEQDNPFVEIQEIELNNDLRSEIDDDLNNVREEMEREEVESEADPPLEAVKRGPGAPKIVRTG